METKCMPGLNCPSNGVLVMWPKVSVDALPSVC